MYLNVTGSILAALGIIILISRFNRNLIYAVIPATLFLAFCNGFSLQETCMISWHRISSVNNIFLMLVIFQVIWLSQQMKDTGIMKELVAVTQHSVSRKASMALLPALIGILPMPGGALFSAPLVDNCDTGKQCEPLLKTEINYWFRHIWEYWWPLYPGVLLVIDITGIETWRFILLMLPMTLAALFVGYMFLLRKVENHPERKHRFMFKNLLVFAKLMMPVIIIIAVSVIIRLFIPYFCEISKFLPIASGILAAALFLQFKRPLKAVVWRKNIFSGRVIKLFILVETIRIFGAFVEADLPGRGISLAAQMRTELTEWNIPIICVIMILPFITALTSGLAIGFVGASFPIIMTLIGTAPAPSLFYSTVLLAYGCGYMGMLLSPVHVCLIVTNEHFKTGLLHSLKKLVLPVSLLGFFLLSYYILLRIVIPA